MNKPKLTEFMMRGFSLAQALEIQGIWESLSDLHVESLGFLSTPSFAISGSPRCLASLEAILSGEGAVDSPDARDGLRLVVNNELVGKGTSDPSVLY